MPPDSTTQRPSPEEAQATLAAIVEFSNEAIVAETLDGIITTWNAGAQRLFGYTEAEAVGRPISMLLPPGHPDEAKQILAEVRQGRRVLRPEAERVRKDGQRIFVWVSNSPIKDSAGRIIGVSKIAHDVTDLKLAREALEAAKAKAEAANRAKDQFLATVSHELRTPLTAILGWAQLIKMGVLSDDERREAVDHIDQSAKAQARLVEDILDISRAITGKLRVDLRPMRLAPVAEAACDLVRPTAAAKNIRITLAHADTNAPVMGDAGRLQQVFSNLLGNSLKFTPEGGRIDVALEREGSRIRVRVADNGKGISPEFLPHVFDRFQQDDSSSTRQHGGLGLGLAIVRHIVLAHGGEVGVHSDGPGKGATFTISLPVAAAADQPGESPSTGAGNDGVGLAGLRVLVVDDDQGAREVVTKLLAAQGAQVTAARSASEAIGSMSSLHPHVLVSDIAMPWTDGLELIRQVREMDPPALARTPAVALTGYASIDDRASAISAGYDAYLAKPVQPDELVRTVARLARR